MLFTNTELEAINLKAIVEAIDSMVNYEIIEIRGIDPESEVYFRSITHQKYFYIILVDFLSYFDKTLTDKQNSSLGLLKDICENSKFNHNNSISSLHKSIDIFKIWLDKEVKADLWFPTIERKIVLNITRYEFIKICGNISKHNFARLTRISKELILIFKRNHVNISFHESLLILNEFYEQFHMDILNYHGSNITEMLNNIRWGIHEYLLPEFKKSIKHNPDNPIMYEYTYPKEIVTDFAKSCYWDLMNIIRGIPYVKKFITTKYLKMRY